MVIQALVSRKYLSPADVLVVCVKTIAPDRPVFELDLQGVHSEEDVMRQLRFRIQEKVGFPESSVSITPIPYENMLVHIEEDNKLEYDHGQGD